MGLVYEVKQKPQVQSSGMSSGQYFLQALNQMRLHLHRMLKVCLFN